MAAKKTPSAPKVVMKTVRSLKPYENNPRIHDDRQISKLAKSITEFGFTIPILIDAKGRVLAGHGRLLAAKELKISKVPCIVATGWSDEQKRAYTIADNRLAEESSWDVQLLQTELQGLVEIDIDVELLGMSELEVQRIVDTPALRPPPDEFPADHGGGSQHTCPKCGFEFN